VPTLLGHGVDHVAEEDAAIGGRDASAKTKFDSNWPFASSWSFA
jgi:hypothetical protein